MFVDESLQIEVAVNSLPIAPHYVIDAHAAQALDCFELHVTGSRCVQEEPTYESQPQAAKAGAIKETKETNNDECESDNLPDARCDSRSTRAFASDPPDDRAQHTTTVERKPRDHVEDRQRDVNDSQPAEHNCEG